MRNTVAKKIRRAARRNWIEYVQAVEQWPLSARLRLAWHIVVNPMRKKGVKKHG